MVSIISRLDRKLIVSSQAMNPASPLKRPEILALMAQAAELGGAGGFRVNGADVVRALRPLTDRPIIGIVKDLREGFDNYITTTTADIASLHQAGADIIAIQATEGTRPGPDFSELVAFARDLSLPVMADISTFSEAEIALGAGAELIATTMVGYTPHSTGATRPPYDLVRQLCAELDCLVVVEGGVWSPEHIAESFAAGAYCVVSGSAITAPDLITQRLVDAIPAL